MTIQSQKELRWDVEVGGVLREWVFLIIPQWCQGPNALDPWQWQSLVQVRLRESLSRSLSPTKSECLQMMNQCAKPSSSSFLLWTACSLRLLLCRDLLLTPTKPAFLSICAPYTHLLHSHVQKKWAEFPGCRDISPQWPQSTPSELSYTCVCLSILSSFPVTPVNSVPE